MGVIATVQRNLNFINVKDKGAQGDGVSDDTTAILAALNDANNAGGGTVFVPAGIFISGNQPLYPNVHIRGAGISATIIKLKNGANADLFSAQIGSINVGGTGGTGGAGTLFNFGIYDMTIDGNKSNQSGTSYPLRFYGYGFILQNLRIKNGLSGGILSDWNGGGTSGADSMEAQVIDVKVHDCGGIAIQWGGPHDSHLVNILAYNTGSHGIHIGPNASAMLFVNTHVWGVHQGASCVAWLIEGGYGQYSNCVAEGSDTMNVVFLAGECSWVGGHVFGVPGLYSSSNGIQIGQAAGLTPYANSVNQSAGVTTLVNPGGLLIDSMMSRLEGSHGAIWFSQDGGNNNIRAEVYQTAGSILTGTISENTHLQLSTSGLTADGTLAKGGKVQHANNSNLAFTLTDGTQDIFNVNTNGKKIEAVHGAYIHIYSDGYVTEVLKLGADAAGTIGWGNSDTTLARSAAGLLKVNGAIAGSGFNNGAITNGSTLTVFGATVNDMTRVSPAGNVTGIIIGTGNTNAQEFTVINESAFTVTFDVAATSHVADGANITIGALRAAKFKWNATTSLWYKIS